MNSPTNEKTALSAAESSVIPIANVSSEMADDECSKKCFEDVIDEKNPSSNINEVLSHVDCVESFFKEIVKSDIAGFLCEKNKETGGLEKSEKPNVRNLSEESEMREAYETNKELLQKNKESDDKIIELAGEFETVDEENSRKNNEILQLRSQKESQDLDTSSFAFSSSTSFLDTSTDQPSSFPSFASPGGYNKNFLKLQSLERELKHFQANIEKLKEANIEKQLQNRRLDARMKELRFLSRQREEQVELLNRQLNPISSESVRLNPGQQQYFDQFRDRLQRQADEFKEQRDKSDRDSREQILLARRNQTEAEKKLESLKQKITQLTNNMPKIKEHTEELRTALVVATRVTPQSVSSRNQTTIESYRSSARRLETEMRTMTRKYEEAEEEKRRLEEQLRQRGTTRIVQTTYPGGGRTRIERRNNNVIIYNEGVNIAQDINDDIESD